MVDDAMATIAISITDKTISFDATVGEQPMPIPELVFWLRMLEYEVLGGITKPEPTDG